MATTRSEARDWSVYRVGLTGGIATGKSTVAGLFATLGVPVIDTDLIAREVVAPGTPGLAEVSQAFGPGVLKADGRVMSASFGVSRRARGRRAASRPRGAARIRTA